MCLPLPSQGRFIPYLGLWMPKSTPYFTHAILLNKQESHWYLWVQSTVPWKVHIPWDCHSLLECNFLCFKSSNNNTKKHYWFSKEVSTAQEVTSNAFNKIHFLCLYHTNARSHMHIYKRKSGVMTRQNL